MTKQKRGRSRKMRRKPANDHESMKPTEVYFVVACLFNNKKLLLITFVEHYNEQL